jgi:hypothetical protein
VSSNRIRTSADILKWYPALSGDPQWSNFAAEFDKPICVSYRTKAARRCIGKTEPEVSELHSLCDTVLHLEDLACLPSIADDGTETYLSEIEISKRRSDAAITLAEMVKLLLQTSDEGERLRQALKRNLRRSPPPKPKEIRHLLMFQAFVSFVNRTKRLPLKSELNVEANRVSCAKPVPMDRRDFGEFVLPDGTRSSSQKEAWIVLRSFENYGYGEFEVEHWNECEIVPNGAWKAPKWQSHDYGEISTEMGFKGLAENHQSKGRRGLLGGGHPLHSGLRKSLGKPGTKKP